RVGRARLGAGLRLGVNRVRAVGPVGGNVVAADDLEDLAVVVAGVVLDGVLGVLVAHEVDPVVAHVAVDAVVVTVGEHVDDVVALLAVDLVASGAHVEDVVALVATDVVVVTGTVDEQVVAHVAV